MFLCNFGVNVDPFVLLYFAVFLSTRWDTGWKEYLWNYVFSGTSNLNSINHRLLQSCHIDDTSPEHTAVGRPPGWVDRNVGQLHIKIDHLGLFSRLPIMNWWPKWCNNDTLAILLRIWLYHVTKKTESEQHWRQPAVSLTVQCWILICAQKLT